MEKISSYMIPLVVLIILIYSIRKRINVYDSFIEGAKEGIELAISIFPCYLAMIFGVNLLTKSNFIIDLLSLGKNIFDFLHIPIDIMPLALTRSISGNASFAVMINIIKSNGPDSFIGRLASIMQGATDTTIYVISLYFGSLGIKNIKYALKVGLIVDFITFITAIIVASIIW